MNWRLSNSRFRCLYFWETEKSERLQDNQEILFMGDFENAKTELEPCFIQIMHLLTRLQSP